MGNNDDDVAVVGIICALLAFVALCVGINDCHSDRIKANCAYGAYDG